MPKTIDNDLGGTDMTFGFDTAMQVATEAIDRLHTTAESHNRVMVVEVMGRHAGWIALHSGLAGGADVILIPERPFDIDEVCGLIRRRHARGRYFSIVVVAEGAVPRRGNHGGDERRRGRVRPRSSRRHRAAAGDGDREPHRLRDPRDRPRATPSAAARPRRSTACWPRASAWRRMDAAEGRRWGTMAALRGTAIELVPLAEAVAELRTVPASEYEVAETFFG